MALDDYLSSEVAVAVAATAAIMSPRARNLLRRGLVYGLAGVLTVGDKLGALAHDAQSAAQMAAASAGSAVQGAGDQARRQARSGVAGAEQTGQAKAGSTRSRRTRAAAHAEELSGGEDHPSGGEEQG